MDSLIAPRTILLVEDEAVLAIETAAQLEKAGYAVITAFHGAQALAALQAAPVDLVLLDVELGKNSPDGIEVAGKILSRADLPIVFLTGHSEPELVARIEQVTSYGYVLKGSGEYVLQATLQMAFRLHQARRLLDERESRLEKALVEQRAAAEALQQKSDELEMFFENAHELLCFADLDGYFRRVNREWEHVLGYTTAELNGQRYLDFVHPDDLPATLAVMVELSGQNPVQNFVNRYRCRDGSYRWIEWRSKPYGQLLLGAASDITERVRFEMAQGFLARSSSRGKVFFQELAHFLAEHLAMDFVSINRLDADGQTARTLAVVADGRLEETSYTRALRNTPCGALANQQVCCFPNSVRTLFPADPILQALSAESYAGVTLFDSSGQPAGVIAVIGRSPLADTRLVESILRLVAVRAAAELERAQAEEALRASEERYRALIELSPDPISVSDLNGQFLMVNRAALREFGFESMEELRASGQTTIDFMLEEDRPRALANIQKTLVEGSVRNIEYRVRRKSGVVKWIEISAALLRDGEGRPAAFIGISHDITERKRLLDEKSTLLRDLQHRIKNSLALISSLVMLEQEHAQQPETRKALNEIYDRVNSLSKLYNILYEAQNIQKVDLGQYLEQVAQSLVSSYSRTGVDVEMDFDPLMIDVRLATPFGLILNELLTNALKYAFPNERAGKIRINLHLAGENVVLEVCDNGVGLPAGGAVKDHSHGLGLQLVDLLVNQLRGRLNSQCSGFTRFVMEVPYSEVC